VPSEALDTGHEGSQTETASTAAYVDALLAQALEQRASDLHLEPQKVGLQIRLRVDGLLHDLPSPSPNIAQRLCARIKIMTKLDIAERRLPQDGRISVHCRGQQMDLRVSSLPTLWGEKLVLRIVLQESSILPLTDLGLSEHQHQQLSTALAQPQGLVLVTGPTGSGKTLTLYSALQTLNQRHRNISTAEEPVEIPLPGVNQVGIKPQIGLDFGNTLRALLRQDPDVLMVGEIRDSDTASMAIRAAQTGHLVLSTVHTKSASATLGRMRQLGISDRDLQESVTLVVAQRLLRRLCDHCKSPHRVGRERDNDTLSHSTTVFRPNPRGCSVCLNGYRGRLGIFELCSPLSWAKEHPNQLSERVLRPRNANDRLGETHRPSAFAPGPDQHLRTMGLTRYFAGETSLEEIERVLPRGSFGTDTFTTDSPFS
jgi:type IV pilus assembly protein PilB